MTQSTPTRSKGLLRTIIMWSFLFGLIIGANVLVFGLTHNVDATPSEVKSKLAPVQFGNQNTIAAQSAPSLYSLAKQGSGTFESSHTFTTPETNAAFEFNSIAFVWNEEVPVNTSVAIRAQLKINGTWGDWITLADNEDMVDAKNNRHYSEIYFTPNEQSATAYRVEYTLATTDQNVAPKVSNIQANYMDTRNGPTLSQAKQSAGRVGATAISQPTIITRAQWGANEALMSWPPEYATPQKFVIHHTAGVKGGSDPASVMRGIYQFHAVTRGWGDIGYNFVVDENGNIFEGRKGGNGVIGAHAQGYNTGSIGISNMGNYDSDSVSAAMKNSIVNVIAWKSLVNGIDPGGSGFFVDKNLANVVGHRDVGQTSCPGANLYPLIDTLRSSAATIVRNNLTAANYKGEIVSVPTVNVGVNGTSKVTVRIKNTGSIGWTNTGENFIALNVTNPIGRTSAFQDPSWVLSYRPTIMKEKNVPVGGTATFEFTIKDTQPLGSYNEDFQLVAEHITWIPGTQFTLPIVVAEPYKAELTSVENNFTMSPGEKKTIHLIYKNIGGQTWYNTGDNFVALNVTNPAGRTSVFKDDSWNEYPYRPTRLEPPSVAPGGFGEFDFVIKAPNTTGVYHEDFQAVAEHVSWIDGSRISLNITVADRYRAEITSYEDNFSMQPGEQKTIHLTLKNLGTETWRNTGDNFVALNVTNPAGRTSVFKDASWTEYPYRPTRLEPPTVPPGGFGEFDFVIKAPSTLGAYTEDFQAVAEHVTWIPGSAFTLHITVAVPYAMRIVSTSPSTTLTLQPGQRQAVSVHIQNVGSRTWTNTGDNFVALNITNPPGHVSPFKDTTWNEYPYRPTRLDTASVPPGGTGVFDFYIQAPSAAGTYTDTFQAVAEHQEWITGSQFQINATVVNPYTGQITDKSPSSISMAKNSTQTAWIDIKNTGSNTWKKGEILLVPNGPVGRISAFQDSSWPSSGIATKLANDLAPGATTRMSFVLKSGNSTGSFSESYQLQDAGGNMVTDSSFTIAIQVKPTYLGELVSQTASSLNFKWGEQKTFTVNIKNTGMGTWVKTGTNYVSVKPINPVGRDSIFRDAGWTDATHASLLDSPTTLAPGQTGTFTFSLTAPRQTVNTTETFQIMAENATWIPGTTFSFTTSVTPIKQESLLRIGIFSKLPASNEVVQVSANGAFVAKNGDFGNTHKQFNSGEVVTVAYQGGKYHITGPGLDTLSDSYVRFSPVLAGTILKFSNYSSTVAWDPSINDNTFRGNLLVKYASATSKLWGINEIYMEDYLKGIAEQSNSTTMTHLKTMSVIERTYAQYNYQLGGKHANEGYDLNNTSGDQVYKGYGFEQRSPNVATAVAATRGEMVSKNNDVVVTPYFSRSDGRTRSWNEVWAGTQSHCVSVPDPWSGTGPMSGHGVGLSAYGALAQANEGKDYKTILHYYYTGISIIDYY